MHLVLSSLWACVVQPCEYFLQSKTLKWCPVNMSPVYLGEIFRRSKKQRGHPLKSGWPRCFFLLRHTLASKSVFSPQLSGCTLDLFHLWLSAERFIGSYGKLIFIFQDMNFSYTLTLVVGTWQTARYCC